MELPTDVIVSILLRLPPSSRRLSRLVCRQWRDAVDTRTTEMQSRAKPLVITSTGSAHVLDDLSTTGSRRMLWKFWTNDDKGMSVVGTCNGLICLCDNQKIVGAISLVNPVTGENMSVPETPGCANVRGHGASPHEMYGFAYHPTTGRYKIVHVPCFYGGREGRRKYHVVRVFTLGERWWRDVATGNSARCEYRAGIVGVNGTMYWVAEGTNRVMAFDLDDERLTFIEPPPPLDAPSHSWHLTEVRGRLGIICSVSGDRLKLEVWVRDGSTKMREHKWIRRYIVQSARDMSYGIWHLTRPHFAHSEYLLTERLTGSICDVYKHKPGDDGVVAISERSGGTTIVLDMKSDCFYNYNHSQVFAYVETTEPLSVYKRSS